MKVEDPKEKDEKTRKQSERKVTFKIRTSQVAEEKPTQKKRPVKETSASSRKKKKEDIDKAIEIGNVTIIPPMSCVELIDEITRDGMLKNIQHYFEHLDKMNKKKLSKQFYYT